MANCRLQRVMRRVLFVIIAMNTPPVAAHQLRVFASAIGTDINGRVYFAGGAAASGAQVTLRAAAGQIIAPLPLNTAGEFHYQLNRAMDVRVVAETIDGHRAEWPLTAAEFSAASILVNLPVAPPLPVSPPVNSPPVMTAPDAALVAVIERAIAQHINPLRAELDANAARVRFIDILAGIGYIVGVSGWWAWWRARRIKTNATS